MNSSAVITTHGLSKHYGKTVALHPLTLSVPAGSIFALLGHNGAGKTTLLKLIANIFPPSSGEGTVLGLPLSAIAGDAFTRIGYVSENQELPDWMTVGDFLRYQSGFYPAWDDAALIRRFDLPLDRKLKHLSRGQRMKAALASILAFGPELILLDEPFSGLDPVVRDELIEALLETAATHATTILLSSHDLAEIESFATHVAFLGDGNLLFTEEMTALANRFREITLTLDDAGVPGSDSGIGKIHPPPTWIYLKQNGHLVRFVHTHTPAGAALETEIRACFPNAQSIDAQPMGLRSIFLAVVHSQRHAAAGDPK